tara:strand:- start:530 stop:931 length:402 start_codon:yes stop_codon:yes gene_type:complete
MAHFAKLDENNIVLKVHVLNNKKITDESGNEVEALGVAFLTSLYGHSNWKQASYNNNIRKRYPGPNYKYYEDIDAFMQPQPFASWTINSDKEWEAPIPQPTLTEQQISDNKAYKWDESLYQSDNTKGWVLFDY